MIEIRHNPDGTIDEIIADGRFHLEQMASGLWFVSLTVDGTEYALFLGSSRKITATFEDRGTVNTRHGAA